ncbi:MAG: disulfide bond formation protein B [Alysiella sp.]|uniref:disulfide bond formation protein B n=1 Tax=Alysiella sp. TaxID=1872483 RepID=UPI0026DB6447|nr:disulfide bond formation protein B [Alysiella sp.]MDO4434091.1 disulfide bond formation protein B [Alysiella sp.]
MNLKRKIMVMPRFRLALLLILLISSAGSVASLVAQYWGGMNPCVMCIQQRVALMLLVPTALLGLLLTGNKGKRLLASVAVSVPAVWGLYIALKQIYIQSLPLMEQPSCGAPWTFRLRHMPLFEWYEPIIRGSGACGEVHLVFGIALPVWSAVFFILVLLILWGAWAWTFRLPENHLGQSKKDKS